MVDWMLQPIVAGVAVAPSPALSNGVRHVGPTAPVTTGWATTDLWADTSGEASAIVIRRWNGTAFLPSPVAPLLFDQFTGSNGAALSNWVTGFDPSTGTGSSATIQGNMGRLTTSTTNNFVATGRITRRANITDPTDANLAFSFKFDATSAFPKVWHRAENAMNVDHGYEMRIEKGEWSIAKSVAFAETALSADIPFSYSQGTLYSARFRVVGTTIQAKLWVAADPEPEAWGYSGTDSAVSAAGAVGFSVMNGNSTAVVANWFIDDVTITAT